MLGYITLVHNFGIQRTGHMNLWLHFNVKFIRNKLEKFATSKRFEIKKLSGWSTIWQKIWFRNLAKS